MAGFAWSCVRDALGWAGCPHDFSDLMSGRLTKSSKLSRGLALFVLAGVTWAIWRIRNKMAIERSFPKSPMDVIHSGIAFVQRWRPLLGEDDQAVAMAVGEKVKLWLSNLKLGDAAVSDIVEI